MKFSLIFLGMTTWSWLKILKFFHLYLMRQHFKILYLEMFKNLVWLFYIVLFFTAGVFSLMARQCHSTHIRDHPAGRHTLDPNRGWRSCPRIPWRTVSVNWAALSYDWDTLQPPRYDGGLCTGISGHLAEHNHSTWWWMRALWKQTSPQWLPEIFSFFLMSLFG